MKLTAKTVSPRQYWGKKFINSTSRKYVILVGYREDLVNLQDSTVYFTDENGRMITNGMKWFSFLVSYVPSMLEDNLLKNVEEI